MHHESRRCSNHEPGENLQRKQQAILLGIALAGETAQVSHMSEAMTLCRLADKCGSIEVPTMMAMPPANCARALS